MRDDDLTREGHERTGAYLQATLERDRARERWDRAERDLRDATVALARWLLPDDAKIDERIAVWRGDSLFTAWKHALPEGGHGYRVEVRTRGKHFDELVTSAPKKFCTHCGSRVHDSGEHVVDGRVKGRDEA
jgi:hypothetical protein